MQSAISTYFSKPVLDNDDDTRAASVLHWVLILIGFAGILFPAIGLFLNGFQFEFGQLVSLVIGVIALALKPLLTRGLLQYVSVSLPLIIFLGMCINLFNEPTALVSNLAGFYLVIILSSLLMGGRASNLFMLCCVAVISVIYYGQEYNLLPVPPDSAPDPLTLIDFLSVVVSLFVVAALVSYANQMIRAQKEAVENQANELKETNAALLRSQQTNRAILTSIPDALFRVDPQGQIIDIKESDFSLLSPSSISRLQKGDSFFDIIPSKDHSKARQRLKTVFRAGDVRNLFYELVGPDWLSYFEARMVPINQQEALVIIRDITEERRAEATIQQAQKMDSIGLLAGGIAHDFNNLLLAITGQASVALSRLEEKHPARKHIEKSLRASNKAADLTRQLLTYAGRGQQQRDVLNLNALIEENSQLWETALPSKSRLNAEFAPDLPPVEADKNQIQQVVMNLIINGIEALDDQPGQVLVKTEVVKFDKTTSFTNFIGMTVPLDYGEYVCVEVRDTGKGMSQETLRRIFDPFFTTKETGKGLGLSAALGIVRSHGGALEVYTQPQEGTCFRMYLPAFRDILETHAPPPEGTVGAQLDGRVLVIDDDPAVRETAVDILKDAGLQIFEADNGESGVALLHKRYNEIDLVLLDMQMPVMDGAETFRVLMNTYPDLPIILSSGYTDHQLDEELRAAANTIILPKPYDNKQLIASIQKLLHP